LFFDFSQTSCTYKQVSEGISRYIFTAALLKV